MSALRAGVALVTHLSIPVSLDTVHAVAVATGNRDRILQQIQADGAGESVELYLKFRTVHFAVDNTIPRL